MAFSALVDRREDHRQRPSALRRSGCACASSSRPHAQLELCPVKWSCRTLIRPRVKLAFCDTVLLSFQRSKSCPTMERKSSNNSTRLEPTDAYRNKWSKLTRSPALRRGLSNKHSDQMTSFFSMDAAYFNNQYIRTCLKSPDMKFLSVCLTSMSIEPSAKSPTPEAIHPSPGITGLRCNCIFGY